MKLASHGQNYLEFVSTLWLSFSVLSIIISIIATINFSVFWVNSPHPGANNGAVIVVNVLICLLLVSIPLIYMLRPRALLSRIYLTVPVLSVIWISAGFLYLLDMFIGHSALYIPAFLLAIIMFIPILSKAGDSGKLSAA